MKPDQLTAAEAEALDLVSPCPCQSPGIASPAMKAHRTAEAWLGLTKAGYRELESLFDEATTLRNAALEERRGVYAQAIQRYGKKDSQEAPATTAARKAFLRRTTLYGQNSSFAKIRNDPYSFWHSIDSRVGRGVLRELDQTYANFYRRTLNGERTRGPRFKRRGTLSCINLPDAAPSWIAGGRLNIKGLPRAKLNHSMPLPALDGLKSARIIRRGRRFILQMVFQIETPRPAGTARAAIGIDRGVISPLVDDAGRVYGEDIPPSPETAARIKALQREKEAAPRGSRRRRRIRKRLRRLHGTERIRARNAAHRATTAIVDGRDFIAVERLAVKAMTAKGGSRKRGLNKGILAARWTLALSQIRHKAEGAGALIYEVDPAYTSQECSGCGRIVRKPLSVRMHECADCGLAIGRDWNAAKNILFRGLDAHAASLRNTGGKLPGSPVSMENDDSSPLRGGPKPDGLGTSQRRPPASTETGKEHARQG